MEDYEHTPRTEVKRRPQCGRRDKATVHAVLDEASQCHVDFVVEGRPVVISTLAVQRQPPRRHRQNKSGPR